MKSLIEFVGELPHATRLSAAELTALEKAAAEADVNEVDEKGRTALWCAVRLGQPEAVAMLLEVGARLDAHAKSVYPDVKLWERAPKPPRAKRNTLLHDAAELTGDSAARIVELLVRLIPVDAPDPAGVTPLAVASARNSLFAADALLRAGADAGHVDGNGNAVIAWAHSPEMMDRLRAAGASVNVKDHRCLPPETLLCSAAISGSIDLVRTLITHGATPAINHGGLVWAAHFGHRELVRLLVAHGFSPDDVRNPPSDNSTALAVAARHPHVEIVDDLIAAGAKSLTSAVIHGCGGGSFNVGLFEADERVAERRDTISRLIDAGADVNGTIGGQSALTCAAFSGSHDAIEVLLARGADPNLRGSDRPALWIAAEAGQPRIVERLLAAGVDPCITWNGTTPYQAAKSPTTHSYGEGHRLSMNLLREAGGAPGPKRPPQSASPAAGPRPGARVSHAKFGIGTIEKVEGSGEATKLTVFFPATGSKTMLLKFVTLVG